jgi:AcrR family transcriptional regulator
VSPTQAERRAATTTALVEAARRLFAEDGYGATSLDAVALEAGVTKGALYHHFEGKRQLFEAVFEREVEGLAVRLAEAYSREGDPWTALEAGSRAFLEACLEPRLQRIVLLDGFAALGWDGVRRREAVLLDALEAGVQRAMDAGRLAKRPAAPLTSFLFGALCELAMVVARAPDPQRAQREAVAELRRIMDRLGD